MLWKHFGRKLLVLYHKTKKETLNVLCALVKHARISGTQDVERRTCLLAHVSRNTSFVLLATSCVLNLQLNRAQSRLLYLLTMSQLCNGYFLSYKLYYNNIYLRESEGLDSIIRCSYYLLILQK